MHVILGVAFAVAEFWFTAWLLCRTASIASRRKRTREAYGLILMLAVCTARIIAAAAGLV